MTQGQKASSGVASDVTKGRFVRQESVFRNWIRRDGSTPFTPEDDRYHLYVSLACPWAHRTLIVRRLLGLEDKITFTVVHWFLDEKGWKFVTHKEVDDKKAPECCFPDPISRIVRAKDLYIHMDDDYKGRITVPILWDKRDNVIVNNESSEIIKMLATEFDASSDKPNVCLYPKDMREKIDKVAESFYESVNNGVYRCGFATTQEAYDEAFTELFEKLDQLEKDLGKSRYLCGDKITLADCRLYTTLIRFDAVYVTHFKTNKKRIVDYPNLCNYLRELYQMPEFRETTNFTHIKNHYFQSHAHINPFRIVPGGPDLSYLEKPHTRGSQF